MARVNATMDPLRSAGQGSTAAGATQQLQEPSQQSGLEDVQLSGRVPQRRSLAPGSLPYSVVTPAAGLRSITRGIRGGVPAAGREFRLRSSDSKKPVHALREAIACC
jgi:hypothetical protein